MLIRIETSLDTFVSLEVWQYDSIINLKHKIHQKLTIPVAKQTLIHNGIILTDSEELIHYAIKADDVIKLNTTDANDKQIVVNIMTMCGNDFKYMLNKSDCIVYLKKLHYENTKLPVHCQQLNFAGKNLDDEKTLSDCQIGHRALVYLTEVCEPLIFIVHYPAGEPTAYNVGYTETVARVKRDISEKTRVPVASQRLVYKDITLQDDTKLVEYGIEYGAPITLLTSGEAHESPLAKLAVDAKRDFELNCRKLELAIKSGVLPEIEETLLARPKLIDTSFAHHEHCFPLHLAVKYNQNKSVIKLVQLGAKINAQNANGKTALHCAIEENTALISVQLILLGINTELKDDLNRTYADLAIETYHHDTLEKTNEIKSRYTSLMELVTEEETSLTVKKIENLPFNDPVFELVDKKYQSIVERCIQLGKNKFAQKLFFKGATPIKKLKDQNNVLLLSEATEDTDEQPNEQDDAIEVDTIKLLIEAQQAVDNQIQSFYDEIKLEIANLSVDKSLLAPLTHGLHKITTGMAEKSWKAMLMLKNDIRTMMTDLQEMNAENTQNIKQDEITDFMKASIVDLNNEIASLEASLKEELYKMIDKIKLELEVKHEEVFEWMETMQERMDEKFTAIEMKNKEEIQQLRTESNREIRLLKQRLQKAEENIARLNENLMRQTRRNDLMQEKLNELESTIAEMKNTKE